MSQGQQGQKQQGRGEGRGIRVRGDHGRGDLARSRIGRLWGAWPGSPYGMMRRLFEDMDAMAGGSGMGSTMFPLGEGMHSGDWMPAMDLFDRDDTLVMRAELPGCERSDIEIRVEDGALIVEGERHMDEEQTRAGYYQSERRYGRFQRAISLPSDIDEDNVKANFANGILEVIMPRSGAKRGRSIEIGEAAAAQGKVKH